MTIFIISFTVWALLHSLTAMRRTKAWVEQRVGKRPFLGFYRLFYNLFAVLTFVPVMWVTAVSLPSRTLWHIPTPWATAANLVQIIGLVGLAVSLLQTDFLDFIGVRQAARYLKNEPEIILPPTLVTSGTYALVRHPLYFFSLLVIWFTPQMGLQTFIFNLSITLYFWIGSRVEERRLADFFGLTYATYQADVPGLLPIRLTKRT